MKAVELHEHMRAIGTWVDWDHTCDGFKFGTPDTEVRGIAVGWQSTLPALKQAHALGCNLFVTHEPTFYTHMDDSTDVFQYEHARQKRNFLEETGMVIYRCHDVWDVMPEIGILDSWSRGLGFAGEPIATKKYYSVYPFEGTVEDLARQVRDKVSSIGQTAVQVIGELNQLVHRVGVGTGAITEISVMADMGADAVIATDDGISLWAYGCWALDKGLPLIIVNHTTAEEWGVENLAKYIRSQFPSVPVEYIRIGCMYKLL
jgi:putative NIF3 family GTP cyclohydrolase 1 type 2